MSLTVKHAYVSAIPNSGDATVVEPSDWNAAHVVTGVFGNSRLAKTANYTVLNSDNSQTIALGGTGSTGAPFTLTVNAASGYDANFVVVIVNEDTGLNGTTARGKLIAINGYSTFVLWPGQLFLLMNQNNVWQFNNPGRWHATFAVVLNVDHAAGSDTNNDGLGTGAGAFATIYNAYLVYQSSIDGASTGTIQNANETFTETPPGAFLGSSKQGNGEMFILGNPVTPSLCVWKTAGITADDGAVVSLNGFKMVDVSTGHTGITVDKAGLLVFSNMEFGTFSSGAHIQVFNGGVLIYEAGTYTVSGNASSHIINNGGNVSILGATVSVPNALTFTDWYIGSESGSRATITATFTGTGAGAGSTGRQYNVAVNASLRLFGTTLPGATAGTFSTGGQVTA